MITGQALILDMHSLAWKAYHTLAYKKLSTREGTPTGVFYGMLVSVAKVLKRFPGAVRVLCAYDAGHSGRHELYPDYKANRNHDESHGAESMRSFRVQLDQVMGFFEDVGFHRLLEFGIEADDLVAIYAKLWIQAHKKNSVVVVSIDRDFYQLLALSKRIGFYNHRSGLFFDYKNIQSEIPVDISLYCYYKALVGDPSDNIPRCLSLRETMDFLAEKFPEKRLTKEMRRNLALVRLPYRDMPPLRQTVNLQVDTQQLAMAEVTLTALEIRAFTTESFALKSL